MDIKKNILKEEAEIKGIFKRILKRDFSGNSGQAIKNSVYQISTNLVAKIGALIFTILLAGELITVRVLGFEKPLLSPELFGLYSLALGTILMIYVLSDLGVNQTFIRFVSREIGKKNYSSAKKITFYLYKFKFVLTLFSIATLLLSSYFFANIYYQKPILYALLVGSIYILFANLYSVFNLSAVSRNDFRIVMFREMFFQLSRIILVPALILIFISSSIEKITALIIVGLAFSFLFSLLFSLIFYKKNNLTKIKTPELSNDKKKKINNFVFVLSLTAISGMFFSYIDMLFLGKFVSSENIGFYKAAISLISSAIPLISFSAVLFPIFSRLQGTRAKHALKKSFRLTLLISLGVFVVSIIISSLLIKIIYGEIYSPSILIFQLFTILLITDPLISLYSSFHISQNKPRKVTKAILLSTIINLVLNLSFILYLLSINAGEYSIVLGVVFATLISRFFYLGFLLNRS